MFSRATRSWSRSRVSLWVTVPPAAPRVNTKTARVPATISVAMKIPIARCPGIPSPNMSTTIGATAPATRMVSASEATRQVIIRVRSPYGSDRPMPSVISAGIAT